MATRKKIVIIDGYNVIHRAPALEKQLDTALQMAREGLINYCRQWLSAKRDVSEMLVVFDGDSSVTGENRPSAPGIRSVYTRTGESADDRVLSMVRGLQDGTQCLVVSDDNYITTNASSLGAAVMKSSDFLTVLSRHGSNIKSAISPHMDKTGLSPAEKRKINNSLIEEWGLGT